MTGRDITRADRLRPWTGCWYYPLPEPGMRFVSLRQHTAIQLLHGRTGLSVADAKLLQAIIVTDEPLTPTQKAWVDRLCREHDERLAA